MLPNPPSFRIAGQVLASHREVLQGGESRTRSVALSTARNREFCVPNNGTNIDTEETCRLP